MLRPWSSAATGWRQNQAHGTSRWEDPSPSLLALSSTKLQRGGIKSVNRSLSSHDGFMSPLPGLCFQAFKKNISPPVPRLAPWALLCRCSAALPNWRQFFEIDYCWRRSKNEHAGSRARKRVGTDTSPQNPEAKTSRGGSNQPAAPSDSSANTLGEH